MQQADFSGGSVYLRGPLTSSEKDKMKDRRKGGREGETAGKQQTGDERFHFLCLMLPLYNTQPKR